MDEYEPLNQKKKNNEDQPDKYGNQLKMANPFYDSITARCFHIWITITAKDRHPWITAEVCHPRIMASCFRKLNLTTVCKLQSDYGRGSSPSDYGFLLSQVESDTPFANCNRIMAEVCHPRIMASCFRKLNLAPFADCNRTTAEVRHPRIMASCFRKLNLTTVCKLQSDHGRGLSPSDYCLLHLQLESDNRLHFAIG
jgi:hypothetical protein